MIYTTDKNKHKHFFHIKIIYTAEKRDYLTDNTVTIFLNSSTTLAVFTAENQTENIASISPNKFKNIFFFC